MEYLDIIVLSIIVSMLFGIFIFAPMKHVHSQKTSKNPSDKDD
jgi:hypothetical protein